MACVCSSGIVSAMINLMTYIVLGQYLYTYTLSLQHDS